MTKHLIALGVLFALVAGITVQGQEEDPKLPTRAVAVIKGTKEFKKVRGRVVFTQRDDGVQVTGQVRGLTPGKHGFHIHEYGDISGPDGKAAGGHYNPTGVKHGGPDDEEHHVGDLGNIVADEKGVARIRMRADWLKIHFIVGRALVVHAGEDDLKSQPSGDAGARAGVGVIGIADPNPPKKKKKD